MNYQLVSIDYHESLAKGVLGRIVVTVADEANMSQRSQFIHCPEDNGDYYWRRMSTGKCIGSSEDIYNFLMYSVERMFPAQLALLAKKEAAADKPLQEQTRFDNLQT